LSYRRYKVGTWQSLAVPRKGGPKGQGQGRTVMKKVTVERCCSECAAATGVHVDRTARVSSSNCKQNMNLDE